MACDEEADWKLLKDNRLNDDQDLQQQQQQQPEKLHIALESIQSNGHEKQEKQNKVRRLIVNSH